MNVSDTKTDPTEKDFLYNFFNFVPTLLLQTADLRIFWAQDKNFKNYKTYKIISYRRDNLIIFSLFYNNIHSKKLN